MGCGQPMILRPGSPTVASTVPVEPETACSKEHTEKRAGMAARSAGCLASHGFRITQIRNCWIMIDKDLWENICCAEPIIIFSWPTHGYLVREQLFLLQHHVQASQFSHAEIPKGNRLRFSLLRSKSILLRSVDLPNLETWHVPSQPLAQTKECTNRRLWSFTVKAPFKLQKRIHWKNMERCFSYSFFYLDFVPDANALPAGEVIA